MMTAPATPSSSDGGIPTPQESIYDAAEPSRPPTKPVPASQAEDPRGYQLQQLRRRYKAICTEASDGATSVVFRLKPSDPDFPFELAALDCDVIVPRDYASPDSDESSRPTLRVRNKDIPRGFGINVERGWDRLVVERPGITLLGLTRALDKHLEAFLTEQKADTVKLVGFQGAKDIRHLQQQQSQQQQPQGQAPADTQKAANNAAAPAAPAPAPAAAPRFVPEPSYTRDQVAEAKARRAQEVRQLEARMGRMPTFRRSADGVVFTLPVEPRRRTELPPGLRSVTSVHLIVPLLYPLQDLRVQLNEADADEAEPVEDLFTERAAAHRQMSLMSHINYLSQNLHGMAKQAQQQAQARARAEAEEQAKAEAEAAAAAAADASANTQAAAPKSGAKSHIQVIPPPPEWVMVGYDDEDSSDDSDDSGGAEVETEEAGQPEKPGSAAFDQTAERGTMLRFPHVELHGIELLEVTVLGITVKCGRCKTVNELKGLRAGQEKSARCSKCNAGLSATFRPQAVHEQSTRAGFVDVAGAKVADMLPSTFVPTCARCSTAGLELVSVRGEAMTNVCRECHARFTFKLPEVQFLVVTPGMALKDDGVTGPRRERLGLHAGEPLPSRGACGHYRKSYRWFRFSCCSRVHACDKCHDAAEDHENDWAKRMICGWCSREQRYSPEACGFCGRSVIGRKGRGFWEGGRGTRDQRLMSRKDPRKYKRM